MRKPPVFYRNGGKLIKINLEDVVYIESADNYCKFHTFDLEKIFTIRVSLEAAIQLSDGLFVQVHRSWAVSLNYIEGIEREYVTLYDKRMSEAFQVAISKKYYALLLEKIRIMESASAN